MSGFPPVPALGTKVKTFADASLATLEAAVNDFLKGQGTPVAISDWRVVATQFLFDGTNYVAVVTYTGS